MTIFVLGIQKDTLGNQKMFLIKSVLKTFAKFTGKHLYQSLFLDKVAGLCARASFLMKLPVEASNFIKKETRTETCNFIKKQTLAKVFSCEFYEIFKNTFFTEHLPVTAPGAINVHGNFNCFYMVFYMFFMAILPQSFRGLKNFEKDVSVFIY